MKQQFRFLKSIQDLKSIIWLEENRLHKCQNIIKSHILSVSKWNHSNIVLILSQHCKKHNTSHFKKMMFTGGNRKKIGNGNNNNSSQRSRSRGHQEVIS